MAAPTVQLQNWTACTESRQLAFYRIAGMGHTIPGATGVVWAPLGRTSSFDSVGAMWAVWCADDALCPAAGVFLNGASTP